jgi:hypothetical protein
VNRVVPDSNILISAFLRGGKPLELLELARAGQVELAVSDAILDETVRVLKDKFRMSDEDGRSSGRSCSDTADTSRRRTPLTLSPRTAPTTGFSNAPSLPVR